MPVVVAINVVALGVTYFKTVNANFLKEGLCNLIFNIYFIRFFIFLSPNPKQTSSQINMMNIWSYLFDNTNCNSWNGIQSHGTMNE